jgi:GNAT superfamily N-acetyltransferase
MGIVNTDQNDDVMVHKHYKVARASSRDSMVLSGLTRSDDWSERIAITKRRTVEGAGAIADDIKKGGAFVLTRHGIPIGAAIYIPAKGAAWEVRRLGVSASFAGRGFTQLLIQAVEASARKRNIQALRVPVDADKPSVRRYFEEHGFRLVSSTTLLTQFASGSKPLILQKYLMS